jgi:hypothetical protein
MKPGGKNIFAAILATTMGILLLTASIALLGHWLSTGSISIKPPSNRDLVDLSTGTGQGARKGNAPDTRPPAFRIPLVTIPGGSQPYHAALAGTPGTEIHSDLDVALRPSLKYGHGASGRAAFDVPIIVITDTSAAQPAITPTAVSSTESPKEKLIAANLKMESARGFVTSMCEDHRGRLWVASDNGLAEKPEGCVECFDPSAPELHQWTQYTTEEGLGDDTATAIACDHQGRVWVGHTANHGVSVFNGQKWHNYCNAAIPTGTGCLLGPLGERITHITVSPTNGDVWIATDCGLTRYIISQDDWALYGLPASDPTSLAFDHEGNIYVATEHDGIAMANAADNYKTWRRATAPDDEPAAAQGSGLPSNSTHDILVARDGTVYVATESGLAWSGNSGLDWRYTRRFGTAAGAVQRRPPALSEDYCSCLSETDDAEILVGHRMAGVDKFSPTLNGATSVSDPMCAKAIVAAAILYIGSLGNATRHNSYPGPAGVIALSAPAGKATAPTIAGDATLADLPSGSLLVGPEPLDPEVGLRNLKDLYAAGLFDQFRSGCQRAEGDRRYSAWQPQILYLEWVAERKLGNTEDGDRRRDIFLSRYPGHALAAGMYFEQAMRLLADGQYDSAKRRLATIVDDFPQSNIAREAQVMLGQLDAVALSSGQR